MAKVPRGEHVHQYADLSLGLAGKKAIELREMAQNHGEYRDQILAGVGFIIWRVGEAIVDQIAASGSK